MNAADVIAMCEKNLKALTEHWSKVGMDDGDYIPIARVLVDAAGAALLALDGAKPDVERSKAKLQAFARGLYVSECVEAEPEIDERAECEVESKEIVDHVFLHGEYPDD